MGGAKRGPMAGLANMLGFGGGMPSPEDMAKLAEKMPGGLPAGMPGTPGAPSSAGPRLAAENAGPAADFPGRLPDLAAAFHLGFPAWVKEK